MTSASIVVVGAGHAAGHLAAGLRQRGFAGSLTLVGNEGALPYQRPPLTKGFLLGDVEADSLLLRGGSFYADRGIEVRAEDPAVHIDRAGHELALASGQRLPYTQLVLATGSRAKVAPIAGRQHQGVVTLRNLADATSLRGQLHDGEPRRLVVIGAGFVGLELAAAARRLGHDVVVVEQATHALARAVSAPTADALTAIHRREGVRLTFDVQVRGIRGGASGVTGVELTNGVVFLCDLVVIATGAVPNTDLADAAGLEVEDGIVVDAHLQTADPDVSAIGDCARFPRRGQAVLVRLESVQNATDQADFLATRLTSGVREPYEAVPWFWSDQYDAKLQIAGLVEGYDRTVLSGPTQDNTFSTFCFRGDRLLGIESVNRPADHIFGRRHLASGVAILTPEVVAAPSFSMREFAAR